MNRTITLTVCLAAVLAAPLILAADPSYIGAGKCKFCHKTEYASWEQMAHAKAFEKLKPEEQSNEECLRCHATGASAEMPGVQCEACHGPGSAYKSMNVMKDREASQAAGLVLPDEATCKGCHEQAPHDMPAFDFEAAKAKGLHEVKSDG